MCNKRKDMEILANNWNKIKKTQMTLITDLQKLTKRKGKEIRKRKNKMIITIWV
jgi:hypothetical protein